MSTSLFAFEIFKLMYGESEATKGMNIDSLRPGVSESSKCPRNGKVVR